jgi:hypothetical protein
MGTGRESLPSHPSKSPREDCKQLKVADFFRPSTLTANEKKVAEREAARHMQNVLQGTGRSGSSKEEENR